MQVGGRLEIDDWGALQSAAVNGCGIAFGPDFAVADDLANGRLVALLADFTAPHRPMHLLYSPDRHMTPKLRGFVETVLTHFGR